MTHPVLQGMLMTGCQKQQNILLAFHTFMELSEVKVVWDIDYGYNKDLDIIYIKAKTEKTAENYNYYVPISTSSTVSLNWIAKVQNKILKDDPHSSFILVIKERDSSTVYYKVSEGLIPPLSPESAKRKKSLEEKHKYIESEIKKRKSQLYAEAKHSLSSSSNSTSRSNSTKTKSDKSSSQTNEQSGKEKSDDNNTGSKEMFNTAEEIIVEDNDNDMAIEIIEL